MYDFKTGFAAARAALAGALVCVALALPGVGGAQAAAPDDDAQAAGVLAKISDVNLTKLTELYAEPGKPNLSGFWRPAPGNRQFWEHLNGVRLPPRDASGQNGFPYRPEWQAAYQARRDAEMQHRPYGDPAAMCWPQGMFKAYIGAPTPLEITQTPGRILMQHERLSETRRIYTDGRPHPKDFQPTAEGHSIGHWEGKTLVVDTIGTRREFTMSPAPGMPHSEEAHWTERFTRTDPVTLHIEIILNDPKAMTEPMKTELTYQLYINDHFDEDFCTENNRNRPDENLVVHVDLTPRKHYGFDLPE